MSNMFHTFSASLAEATGKDELLCRGVLRMTILNSVNGLRNTSDPVETMNYILNMTYQDWKAIFEGPALSKILVRLGMKDTTAVSAHLMETLVEQQSLFTMSAR